MNFAANPLLEAFGNAKTIRNNNSSRFGKFIEVHYTSKFTVSGGLFFHYLLEKSRICIQSSGERNYHIFYQLCACLPEALWRKLELGAPDKFHYLRRGCTQYFCSSDSDRNLLPKERKSAYHLQNGAIQDQLIDDLKCFKQTEQALNNFGVDEQQRAAIYAVVAAVLHLGNVTFSEDPDDSSRSGGCLVDKQTEHSLETTAKLMSLDVDLLRQSLTSRIMSTSRAGHKGTVYMVKLSIQQAQSARDALAKAIYSKLFDYIVTKIVNKSIPFSSSSYYIGVLDVAGFEYFQHNSFEQFLINFCNEKLQQFFNQRILKEEQSIYEKEGLNLAHVDFVDNQDCIQLFENKATGIFDLLDEESRLPKPSGQHFTQSVQAANKSHFRLALPRTSKLRAHREIRDDEGFLIRHFAGAVCYETGSFIEKNNDALHASLKNLMLDSGHDILRDLFQDTKQQQLTSSGGGGQQLANFSATSSNNSGSNSNKLTFISVGTTFRSQLNDLMSKLRSTGSHFIRCIKPNSEMIEHKFEGGQILSQLHCSGMDSVLRLMQQGYPSRSSFNDIFQTYKKFLPAKLARLDSHLFCRALFKALGLDDNDFRFGASKVFFRAQKFAEFDQIIRSDGDHVAELVQQVSRWLVRQRWRKVQYCALSAIKLERKILYRRELILRLQRNWRLAWVQINLKFRLTAIRRAQEIHKSVLDFEQIGAQQVEKFAPNKSQLVFEETAALKNEIDCFISKLRADIQAFAATSRQQNNNDKNPKKACETELERLLTKRDLLIRSIKDKIEQQKELVLLEQRIREENKRLEEAELAKRRELALKEQRAALESRRQAEVEQATADLGRSGRDKKTTLVDSGTDPISLLLPNQPALAVDRAEFDQEQRDYELALRLSQDSQQVPTATGGQSQMKLPAAIQPLAPSQNHAHEQAIDSKYDLTKWRYSDLRDTINTSCDLELLEACKREFHRRLKVYHAWRENNSRQSQQRAPSSVLQDAGSCFGAGASNNESAKTPPAPVVVVNAKFASTTNSNEQRFFRIPFVRSSQCNGSQPVAPTATTNGQRGWWYAHFDGQWIARQLELHPDKEPILLVAGRDDIEMCELSLRETRLTSKRGAEIVPQQFEEEWARHGGQPYAKRAINNNNNNTASS